ncbi:MAG: endonuclease III [Blastocatellia bacterium]
MTENATAPNAKKMSQILRLLKKTYPDAHCALHHTTALELLIATILSAQCTDERVNIVTADLFRKYRSAEDFVNAPREELEYDLRSINFFRNKAKSIQGSCQLILEEFDGQVPQTMEELLRLPGVARKTANVVLGNAFGIASGIVVDTHVARLSQRLGLTEQEQPEKIEKDLLALTPRKDWVMLPHLLIFHGRALCKARNPQCAACPLETLCPSSTLK